MKRKAPSKKASPLKPAPLWRWASSAAALGLAALGLALLSKHPALGVLAFVAAALLLLVAAPSIAPPWASHPAPRQAWEPWAVLALALVAAAARFWGLKEFPPGGIFPEMLAVGRAESVWGGYQPHVADFHVGWPTLLFYQAHSAVSLLGWHIAHWRLPSAFYGLIASLLFWGLARRLFSPVTAILLALPFALSPMHVFYSRLFYPIIPLYVAVLAGLYFLAVAWQTRKRWAWAAAGLGFGLALHGYFPGRLVVPLILGWFAWLWFTAPGSRLDRRAWAWLAGGFVLMAGPVLWYAVFSHEEYWGHVSEMRSNSAQGLGGILETLKNNLPSYLRMFHLQADGMDPVDDGLPMIPLLSADPIAGALLPVGVFLCLAAFWRPLPALILAGLVGMLVPAIFGERFPHPTTRRASLALPFAYLAAAYALERLWRGLRGAPQSVRASALALLAAASLAAGVLGWNAYFKTIMGSDNMRWAFNNGARLVGEAMRAHPGAQVKVGAHLVRYPETLLLVPKDPQWTIVEDIEDALTLQEGREALLLLDPYHNGLLPRLRQAYPGAVLSVLDEPGTKVYNTRQDPFYPSQYLLQLRIPADEAANLRGLLADGGQRVNIFDPKSWGPLAGKTVRLRGLLAPPRQGSVPQLSVTLRPGWRLSVDGKAVANGASLPAPGRSLGLEASGPAPKDGLPPFQFQVNGSTLGPDRYLALDPSQGLRYHLRKGERIYSGPIARSGLDAFVFRRWADQPGVEYPYSLELEGSVRVPSDGLYSFRLRRAWEMPQLRIDGKLVFTQSAPGQPPLLETISLKAGQRVRFQLLHPVFVHNRPEERAIVPEVQGPGDPDFKPLPLEWLNP